MNKSIAKQDRRAKKVEKRMMILQDVLNGMKKHRAQFDDVTKLAGACSERISEKQNKPCSKVTLLRNPRYRHELNQYMADMEVAGTRNISKRSITDERAKAVITEKEVRIVSLEQENRRLKVYSETLSKQLDELTGSGITIQEDSDSDALKGQLSEIENNFALTCEAMRRICETWPEQILVDANEQVFRNGEVKIRRKNVIVDKRLAAPFFDWLKSVEGIG